MKDLYDFLRGLVILIWMIPGCIFVYGTAILVAPFALIFKLKPTIKFSLEKI